MRWSDSIPIVEGEIGPPRSGFVHRLCIRKADGAWGEAARDDGPADTRFCKTRSPWPIGLGGRFARMSQMFGHWESTYKRSSGRLYNGDRSPG
jgi:hypothetical protein